MQTKKRSGLASLSGATKLANQAVMGVAMGLAFVMILIFLNPAGTATLIEDSGHQAVVLCVGTIVLTFGIGATLTGAIFILSEDR